MDDYETICYVRADQLEAYEEKFGKGKEYEVSVTFRALDVPSKTLAESDDNSSWISDNANKVYDITLTRTLNTGGWNTFCVPFDISYLEIRSIFGEGTEVKELYYSYFDEDTKELELSFYDADDIEAGKPYLVKIGSANNVVNPVFSSAIISNTATTIETDCVDFVPVMSPASLSAKDKTVLFVAGGNSLTYPSSAGNINGFRGYFKLKGEAAKQARAFRMSLGDNSTGIVGVVSSDTTSTGDAYTLDGRRIEGQPTAKGVYIVNGKKTIIK